MLPLPNSVTRHIGGRGHQSPLFLLSFKGLLSEDDVIFFLQSAGVDLEVNSFIVLIQVVEADSPCSRLLGRLHKGLLQHLVQATTVMRRSSRLIH